jgi:hypothetical protein
MEVGCIASVEGSDGTKRKICSAYFTFVLLVKQKLPSLDVGKGVDEQRRYAEAQERRAIRLSRRDILAKHQDPLSRSSRSLTAGSGKKKNGTRAGHFETLNLVLPQ